MTRNVIGARLLIADVLELQGKKDEARAIARNELPIAEAMSLGRLEAHAREHLDGRTMLEQTAAKFEFVNSQDDDDLWADAADAELQSMASDLADTMGLPADRLANILDNIMACRAMSKERKSFCRHLELLEDLRHTQEDETKYAKPSVWKCHCAKFDHWSAIESKDWQGVLPAFRDSRCSGCGHREPKQVG